MHLLVKRNFDVIKIHLTTTKINVIKMHRTTTKIKSKLMYLSERF